MTALGMANSHPLLAIRNLDARLPRGERASAVVFRE